jgi:hypothetical protein
MAFSQRGGGGGEVPGGWSGGTNGPWADTGSEGTTCGASGFFLSIMAITVTTAMATTTAPTAIYNIKLSLSESFGVNEYDLKT